MEVSETRGIFDAISRLTKEGKTFAVATITGHTGSVPRRVAKMVIQPNGSTVGTIGGGCVETEVVGSAIKLLKEGAKGVRVDSYDLIEEDFGGVGMNCGGKVEVAIEIIEPTPKLLIIGSGHMAQAVSRIGKMLEFDIIILDPMAKKQDFPDAEQVITDFVEAGFPKISIDGSTYVVILTQHKDDVPALTASLKTSAGYIGMIASRRRVALVFSQMLKQGFTEEQLSRVYSPVGLDIGAETPEEIAVSIMAEVVKIKRLGKEHGAISKKIGLSTIKALEE